MVPMLSSAKRADRPEVAKEAISPAILVHWRLFSLVDDYLARRLLCPPSKEDGFGILLTILQWIFTFPVMLVELITRYLIWSLLWDGLVLFVLPFIGPTVVAAGFVVARIVADRDD